MADKNENEIKVGDREDRYTYTLQIIEELIERSEKEMKIDKILLAEVAATKTKSELNGPQSTSTKGE